MKRCMFTEKFDDFINDTLSEEERKALLEHLDSDCELCAEFLHEASNEKRITLLSLIEDYRDRKAGEFSYSEAKKNAILRTILSQEKSSYVVTFFQKALANIARPAFASALIAVFALSFVFIYLRQEAPYTGIKGGVAPSIILTAQFGSMTHEDRKILGFVENNMTLSRSHDLFLSFELKTAGYLYLIEEANENMHLIYPGTLQNPLFLKTGTHDVKINNRIAAYSLSHIDTPEVSFCAYIVEQPIKSFDELSSEGNKSCLRILLKK